MASYRTLQPGLLSVTRDDGQQFIAPMDEATAQAQGLTPEAPGPAPIPQPNYSNPYSMSKDPSALAMNSPFGIRVQHGGELASLPDAGGGAPFGSGVSKGPDKFASVRTHLGEPTADTAQSVAQLALAQSGQKEAADVAAMSPAQQERYFQSKESAPSKGAQSIARDLVRAGSGARPEAPGGGDQPSMDPMFSDYIKSGGGGGGRPRLAVTSETKKYHEAGPVDPALAADIAKRQGEQDQQASNQLEDEALHKGDYLEQQAALQQQEAARVQDSIKRRQAIDGEIGRLNAQSQTAQDELSRAKPKQIDKYWGDMPMASKLMTGIAVGLGGFQAGSRGGENTALKQVNMDIDRWVNDQRQHYEAAKDKLSLTNNRYKDALSIYGSPEAAQAQLQLQALAARDALIKTQAEQIGTQDALGRAQLALQDSQLQRQKLTAQMQAAAGAEVEAKFSMQGGAGGGNDVFARIKKAAEGKKGLDYLQGKTDANGKAVGGPGDQKLAVHFADGSVGYAGNSKEKTQSQKVVRSATGAIEDIDRLIQLTDSAGSRAFGTDDAERAKTLAGGLTFKAHDAMGVATFQEATAGMMHQMIGDPANFFRNPASKAKLLELRRQMEDEIHNQKRFLGKGGGAASNEPDDSETPDTAQEIVE